MPIHFISLILGKVGADVRDLYGNTALHIAAWHADKGVIEALVQLGVPLNATDDQGASPVFMTCLNNNPGVIETLIGIILSINISALFLFFIY